MPFCKRKHLIPAVLLAGILLLQACSTKKNTASARWWKSFNTRYNTYYNATVAYVEGAQAKEDNNVDNFTEPIPLYTIGNKGTVDIGKANFEKAVEKCKKAIQLYSIRKRPVWPVGKKKTDKDREWLARREFNPFLWKAWLLMGRSQFYMGAFDDAASTFAYMSRIYSTQPAIYDKARAWLAKCYIEQGWMYDAEDVMRQAQRDSINWRAQKEWDYTTADYYIKTGELDKAVTALRKVIKHEMRRKQKAREWFLMGQLEELQGHRDQAYKAYKHVIALNPPYILEFNARIAMAEVAGETNAPAMIKKLKSMARSDKNKDYLEQVYYAIGNLHLAQRDTTAAITAYEKGVEGATRTGVEKGMLLLKLGNIYWDKEKYSDAQRCYGEAIGLLDKEKTYYPQLSQRSVVLDELVPYTDAVFLQDSLISLSNMNEKDRNAAIDRTIEALKKKEKEEKDRLAEQNAMDMAQNGNGGSNLDIRNNSNVNKGQNTNVAGGNKGEWYFYNPVAVAQGKAAFQKQWGKRKNEDNWQRSNKTVVADLPSITETQTEDGGEATGIDSSGDDGKKGDDDPQNDPHKREYYMAQIPFSDEQKKACDEIIKDGLFNEGVIFKDKLDNLTLSEKALRRLTDHYPDFEKMDEAYYHLFLLYSRKGETAVAEQYISKLKDAFPKSKWTKVLTNPYFKENAQFGVQIEDSLYAATYDAFKAGKSNEVKANEAISAKRFPMGANRDKFIFINGMDRLSMGDVNGCLSAMEEVVSKYQTSSVANLAGMIINGVKAGRVLHTGRFDMSNVWQQRTQMTEDAADGGRNEFSTERNTPFTFMVVYMPDSVDQNRLLFELAKYNFTSYLARSFEIEIEQHEGLNYMMIRGFANYDEALQYARAVYRQKGITASVGKHGRTIIISDENIPLLGTRLSYDDYDKFYAEHFAPLKTATIDLLEEPSEIVVEGEDNDVETAPQQNSGDEGGTILIPVGPNKKKTEIESTSGTTVIAPQKAADASRKVEENASVTTVIAPQKAADSSRKVEENASGTTVIAPQKAADASRKVEENASGTTVIAPQKAADASRKVSEEKVVKEPAKKNLNEPDGTLIIPEQKTEKVKRDDTNTIEGGTLIVPSTTSGSKTAPVKSPAGGTTVVMPAEKKPVNSNTRPADKSSSVTSEAAKKSADSTKTKTPLDVTMPTPPKGKKQEGPEIYFDNGWGTGTQPAAKSKTQTKKKENKKKEFDLEDEYYDLKGF